MQSLFDRLWTVSQTVLEADLRRLRDSLKQERGDNLKDEKLNEKIKEVEDELKSLNAQRLQLSDGEQLEAKNPSYWFGVSELQEDENYADLLKKLPSDELLNYQFREPQQKTGVDAYNFLKALNELRQELKKEPSIVWFITGITKTIVVGPNLLFAIAVDKAGKVTFFDRLPTNVPEVTLFVGQKLSDIDKSLAELEAKPGVRWNGDSTELEIDLPLAMVEFLGAGNFKPRTLLRVKRRTAMDDVHLDLGEERVIEAPLSGGQWSTFPDKPDGTTPAGTTLKFVAAKEDRTFYYRLADGKYITIKVLLRYRCRRCQNTYLRSENRHGSCVWHPVHPARYKREYEAKLIKLARPFPNKSIATLVKERPDELVSIIQRKLLYIQTRYGHLESAFSRVDKKTGLTIRLDEMPLPDVNTIMERLVQTRAVSGEAYELQRIAKRMFTIESIETSLNPVHFDPEDPALYPQSIESRNPNYHFGLCLQDGKRVWQCCGLPAGSEQKGCLVGHHSSKYDGPDFVRVVFAKDTKSIRQPTEYINDSDTSPLMFNRIMQVAEKDLEAALMLEQQVNRIYGGVPFINFVEASTESYDLQRQIFSRRLRSSPIQDLGQLWDKPKVELERPLWAHDLTLAHLYHRGNRLAYTFNAAYMKRVFDVTNLFLDITQTPADKLNLLTEFTKKLPGFIPMRTAAQQQAVDEFNAFVETQTKAYKLALANEKGYQAFWDTWKPLREEISQNKYKTLPFNVALTPTLPPFAFKPKAAPKVKELETWFTDFETVVKANEKNSMDPAAKTPLEDFVNNNSMPVTKTKWIEIEQEYKDAEKDLAKALNGHNERLEKIAAKEPIFLEAARVGLATWKSLFTVEPTDEQKTKLNALNLTDHSIADVYRKSLTLIDFDAAHELVGVQVAFIDDMKSSFRVLKTYVRTAEEDIEDLYKNTLAKNQFSDKSPDVKAIEAILKIYDASAQKKEIEDAYNSRSVVWLAANEALKNLQDGPEKAALNALTLETKEQYVAKLADAIRTGDEKQVDAKKNAILALFDTLDQDAAALEAAVENARINILKAKLKGKVQAAYTLAKDEITELDKVRPKNAAKQEVLTLSNAKAILDQKIDNAIDLNVLQAVDADVDFVKPINNLKNDYETARENRISGYISTFNLAKADLVKLVSERMLNFGRTDNNDVTKSKEELPKGEQEKWSEKTSEMQDALTAFNTKYDNEKQQWKDAQPKIVARVKELQTLKNALKLEDTDKIAAYQNAITSLTDLKAPLFFSSVNNQATIETTLADELRRIAKIEADTKLSEVERQAARDAEAERLRAERQAEMARRQQEEEERQRREERLRKEEEERLRQQEVAEFEANAAFMASFQLLSEEYQLYSGKRWAGNPDIEGREELNGKVKEQREYWQTVLRELEDKLRSILAPPKKESPLLTEVDRLIALMKNDQWSYLFALFLVEKTTDPSRTVVTGDKIEDLLMFGKKVPPVPNPEVLSKGINESLRTLRLGIVLTDPPNNNLLEEIQKRIAEIDLATESQSAPENSDVILVGAWTGQEPDFAAAKRVLEAEPYKRTVHKDTAVNLALTNLRTNIDFARKIEEGGKAGKFVVVLHSGRPGAFVYKENIQRLDKNHKLSIEFKGGKLVALPPDKLEILQPSKPTSESSTADEPGELAAEHEVPSGSGTVLSIESSVKQTTTETPTALVLGLGTAINKIQSTVEANFKTVIDKLKAWVPGLTTTNFTRKGGRPFDFDDGEFTDAEKAEMIKYDHVLLLQPANYKQQNAYAKNRALLIEADKDESAGALSGKVNLVIIEVDKKTKLLPGQQERLTKALKDLPLEKQTSLSESEITKTLKKLPVKQPEAPKGVPSPPPTKKPKEGPQTAKELQTVWPTDVELAKLLLAHETHARAFNTASSVWNQIVDREKLSDDPLIIEEFIDKCHWRQRPSRLGNSSDQSKEDVYYRRHFLLAYALYCAFYALQNNEVARKQTFINELEIKVKQLPQDKPLIQLLSQCSTVISELKALNELIVNQTTAYVNFRKRTIKTASTLSPLLEQLEKQLDAQHYVKTSAFASFVLYPTSIPVASLPFWIYQPNLFFGYFALAQIMPANYVLETDFWIPSLKATRTQKSNLYGMDELTMDTNFSKLALPSDTAENPVIANYLKFVEKELRAALGISLIGEKKNKSLIEQLLKERKKQKPLPKGLTDTQLLDFVVALVWSSNPEESSQFDTRFNDSITNWPVIEDLNLEPSQSTEQMLALVNFFHDVVVDFLPRSEQWIKAVIFPAFEASLRTSFVQIQHYESTLPRILYKLSRENNFLGFALGIWGKEKDKVPIPGLDPNKPDYSWYTSWPNSFDNIDGKEYGDQQGFQIVEIGSIPGTGRFMYLRCLLDSLALTKEKDPINRVIWLNPKKTMALKQLPKDYEIFRVPPGNLLKTYQEWGFVGAFPFEQRLALANYAPDKLFGLQSSDYGNRRQHFENFYKPSNYNAHDIALGWIMGQKLVYSRNDKNVLIATVHWKGFQNTETYRQEKFNQWANVQNVLVPVKFQSVETKLRTDTELMLQVDIGLYSAFVNEVADALSLKSDDPRRKSILTEADVNSFVLPYVWNQHDISPFPIARSVVLEDKWKALSEIERIIYQIGDKETIKQLLMRRLPDMMQYLDNPVQIESQSALDFLTFLEKQIN